MDASSLKETKQQSSSATCGYERLTVSKLSWAVLMRKHLTIYSNKLRRYLGKQLSTKKVISVQGRSVKSTLHSVPDCQAITKKAIVERLKKAYQEKVGLMKPAPNIQLK